jgi:SAM-dependent methyltransferase
MAEPRVINLHTVVQFASGRIWIHSADSETTLSGTDREILRTLAAFLHPADPDAVVAEAPDRDVVRQHIADLERIGALVPAVAANTDAVDAAPGTLVERFLSPIAASLDSLAGALSAIGPEVAQAIRRDTGVSIEARLAGASAGLIATQQAIGSRIPGWINAQLQRLKLPDRGLSIHVGSGSATLDGWINIDVWPAQLSLDFRWGLPFPNESAERIYLSHVLEHAYYPDEALQLLREIHRVLRPRGRVRIIVPDIEACIAAYVTNDRCFFEGRHERWPHWKIRTRMESFLGFAGVGPFPGMFAEAHKWGYDFETMTRILTDAGFSEIVRSTFQGSGDPAFRVDDASAWAGANVDGRYYSLFVEARR